jgi:FtsZ-binding cell division protein ZapB
MEIIESLTRKVHEAARRIKMLQDERARLLSEIDHLKLQVKRQHELARENDNLKKNQEAVRTRLIRIQKKLDKQLVLIDVPTTPTLTEATYEEPVQ